jgi:hypothetical protein
MSKFPQFRIDAGANRGREYSNTLDILDGIDYNVHKESKTLINRRGESDSHRVISIVFFRGLKLCSEAVYTIAYIFSGGPAPCQNSD